MRRSQPWEQRGTKFPNKHEGPEKGVRLACWKGESLNHPRERSGALAYWTPSSQVYLPARWYPDALTQAWVSNLFLFPLSGPQEGPTWRICCLDVVKTSRWTEDHAEQIQLCVLASEDLLYSLGFSTSALLPQPILKYLEEDSPTSRVCLGQPALQSSCKEASRSFLAVPH